MRCWLSAEVFAVRLQPRVQRSQVLTQHLDFGALRSVALGEHGLTA
jgi:hypothetical protein